MSVQSFKDYIPGPLGIKFKCWEWKNSFVSIKFPILFGNDWKIISITRGITPSRKSDLFPFASLGCRDNLVESIWIWSWKAFRNVYKRIYVCIWIVNYWKVVRHSKVRELALFFSETNKSAFFRCKWRLLADIFNEIKDYSCSARWYHYASWGYFNIALFHLTGIDWNLKRW